MTYPNRAQELAVTLYSIDNKTHLPLDDSYDRQLRERYFSILIGNYLPIYSLKVTVIAVMLSLVRPEPAGGSNSPTSSRAVFPILGQPPEGS